MNPRILAALAWALSSTFLAAQNPRWTLVDGWRHTGLLPPRDIAHRAGSDGVFSAHPQLTGTGSLLAESTTDGILLAVWNCPLPIEGLCSLPNGHLLAAAGNHVREITGTGQPVAGGIDLQPTGLAGIDAIERRPANGEIWVHDGPTAAFWSLSISGGAPLLRFVQSAQAFTFHPAADRILAALPAGPGIAAGALREFGLQGQILASGNGPESRLFVNVDSCAPLGGPVLDQVTGLSFDSNRGEILAANGAVVSGSPTGLFDLARFAPQGSAFIGRLGPHTPRTDGARFRIGAWGEPQLGTFSFTLFIEGVAPGMPVALLYGLLRNCGNPTFPGQALGTAWVSSALPYGDWSIYLANGNTLYVPIPVFLVAPSWDGIDLWMQFASFDPSSPNLAIFSAAQRVRFSFLP